MALPALLIGLGGRGREWVGEIARHPAWDLAAAVEVDPAAAAAAEQAGVPAGRCYRTVEEACRSVPGLRAAVVATQADAHVEPCRAACAAGLAVMVEKPLAMTLADSAALVRDFEAAGLPFVVAQNYRYLRSHRTVRAVIQRGTLGQVGLVAARYYRGPHDMAPSLARLPHCVTWGVAVHHLDALRWVLGRRPVRVFARSYHTPFADALQGPTLDAMIEFEGGTSATYSATYESRGHEYFERGQEFYERVVGERGTLHVFHRWLVLCPAGGLPRPVRRGRRAETEESVLLGQFAAAVNAGADPECSGRDNLQTMAMVEACLCSDQEGRWVYPQELLDDVP